jgi:hypothetical protein
MKKFHLKSFIEFVSTSKKLFVFILIYLFISYLGSFISSTSIIVNFISQTYLRISPNDFTNSELIATSTEDAKKLIDFIAQRRKNQPQIDFNNWSESTKAQLAYDNQSQYLYSRDFYPLMSRYKTEYAKRGINNKNFNMFYKNPTNYLGLEDVAKSLFDMINQLRISQIE